MGPSARREEPPPFPPRERPERATPELVIAEVDLGAVRRLHNGPGDPLKVPRYPKGRHRFDSPDGRFRVTYANTSRKGCVHEIYGDEGVIEGQEGDRRHFFEIAAERKLRMIALDEADVWSAFGLDLRICSTLKYERTQEWARVLYSWYPEADGIRYLGRNSAPERNHCFFLDRCEEVLSARHEGPLRAFHRTVQAVARVRGIASEV